MLRVGGVTAFVLLVSSARAETPVDLGDEAPYVKGQRVPEGYHLEERPRYGLVYVGIALAAPFYAVGALTAAGYDFRNSSGWLLLPVAGPWAYVGANLCHKARDSSEGEPCLEQGYVNLLAVFSGLAQVTGASMFAAGMLAKRTWIVRNEGVEFTFIPEFSPDARRAGFAAIGTF